MPDKSSRRSFLQVVGAGAAVSLAGCGGNEPADTSTATPTDTGTPEPTDTATPEPTKGYTGGSLSLASPGPVQTLDPVNAKGSGAGYNQYQEPLLHFPNGDLPAQPLLAESIDVSSDGLVYTIKLKEGVKFHDGQELTASDVAYSWRRMAGSPNSRNKDDIIGGTFTIAHEGDTGASLENYKPGSLAVEAKSKYVFEFELESAFHGAEAQIAGGAFGVIPENSVGDIEGYDGKYDYNEFFGTKGDGPKFVGTGPFKVESWSKGDAITLSRFKDYHGEGPYIDEITYTVIGNANTRWKRFKNGNLDMVGGVPLSKFSKSARTIETDRGTFQSGTYELPSGDTVEYGQSTPLSTDYIVFNAERTPRPVRRAFAYMLNQHEVSDILYKDLNPPAYHITPPAVFPDSGSDMSAVDAYDAHAKDGALSETDFGAEGYPYGYDETRLDEARKVMEDAGYSESNQYEVEFTVFSGDPEWDKVAKRLRDKATNAHINVTIQKAGFGTIIGKAINGKMDMFSLGDGMEWPESDNFLRFLHPYSDPTFMFTRWTTKVTASGVEMGDDSAETVKNLVHQQLPDDVQKRHVSATKAEKAKNRPADNSVSVFIEPTTKSELKSAINAAGYSASSYTGKSQPFTENMRIADEAWNQYYKGNKGPGKENQKMRDKAYRIIEEMNWAGVQELPLTHGITQRFQQPKVNVRMAGTMENQTFNTLTLRK